MKHTTKRFQLCSIAGMQRAFFLKPLAILLALMLLPKVPFLGTFSLAPSANAQIVIGCTSPSRILQVCDSRARAWETEAIQQYVEDYKLPSTDASLIFTYGREDLRMDIRAYLLTKLQLLIAQQPANRSATEQGMYDSFQALITAREIAMYTEAVKDRDAFLTNYCTWKPDPGVQGAYDVSISVAPYCGDASTTSPIFGGSPDLPTKNYFITHGMRVAYLQKFADYDSSEKFVLHLNESQVATVAGVAAGGAALSTATFVTLGATSFIRNVFPNSTRGLQAVNKGSRLAARFVARSGAAFARATGAAMIIMVAALIVIGSILAAEAAKQRLETLQGLDNDLAYAKNNPANLQQMLGTQEGQVKISTVFLEISLPDFPSSAPLPLHSSADATFVTAGVGHPGPIKFPDRDGTAWTAEPYGEWFVQTGVTSTGATVTSFNNSLSFMAPAGPLPTAYKAWRHGGIFTVVKLAPGPDDKICDPGSDGLYHGDTSRCHSYSTDRLQMYDTNSSLMQVSLSQGVKLDSASYAAFTSGVPQSVAIQAQGIPAPNLTVTSSLPAGFTLGPSQEVSPGVMRTSLIYSGGGTPGNYIISLLLSNQASETYIDYTVALGTIIKITSPPAISMTYGVYADFLVYATGSPVSYVVDDIFPAGITVTDNGNGSASIRGVPNRASKSYCLANLNNPGLQCGIIAKNVVASDFQKPTITLINPPPASITSQSSTLFLAGEPGGFAITQNGPQTKDGKGFYRVVDLCTAAKPAWLTETLLPSGHLVVGGTPPADTPPQTHVLLNFGLALNGEPDPPQSCARSFLLTVDVFPRFVGPSHLMVRPGQTVPDNKFQSANPFTLFRMDGTLPTGVSFQNDGDGFSFRGTLASDAPTGDYKLYITATSATGTKATELFHFLVGEPPSDPGPRTFNLVINTPVRLIINPQGFPKQEIADAGLPGMTSSMTGIFAPGITKSDGFQPGSIVLEGTPTELFTPPVPAYLTTSNGVGNFSDQYNIRVIQPGDINADRRVNCSDIGMVKAALNKKRGFPGYDYLADVNNDGSVDVRDLALVSKNLPAGTRCP